MPAPQNLAHYARIVERNALLRRLIEAGSTIAELGFSGGDDVEVLLDRAEQMVLEVSRKRSTVSFDIVFDVLRDVWGHFDEVVQSGGKLTGISTGFRELDEMTSGLQRSDLIVVAGRPSMGKTSFALTLARNAAVETGAPVAVYSLEMNKIQLVQRLLCSEALVNAREFRTGTLPEKDLRRLSPASGNLGAAKIYIDDTPNITAVEVRAKSRRLQKMLEPNSRLGLIVIDYLQLMQAHGRSENRQQEVSDISRALKGLARELEVPVIAVSQLSREVERRSGDRRPILSDLRESGAIEQDADVVMFIYRDEYYNPESKEPGVADIIIAKQRNGPTGVVRLAFRKEYTKFTPLAYEKS